MGLPVIALVVRGFIINFRQKNIVFDRHNERHLLRDSSAVSSAENFRHSFVNHSGS